MGRVIIDTCAELYVKECDASRRLSWIGNKKWLKLEETRRTGPPNPSDPSNFLPICVEFCFVSSPPRRPTLKSPRVIVVSCFVSFPLQSLIYGLSKRPMTRLPSYVYAALSFFFGRITDSPIRFSGFSLFPTLINVIPSPDTRTLLIMMFLVFHAQAFALDSYVGKFSLEACSRP